MIILLLLIILLFIFNYNYKKEHFRSNLSTNLQNNVNLNTGSVKKIYTDYDQPMHDLAGTVPLDFDTKDYNNTIADQNKDLVYYYNDAINQSKISETAFNVVNQIDKIDYSNVVTGFDKCKEKCKGVCFEGGYTGTATCYPDQTKSFDWGTLYKNPTFTYGYNAWNDLDNLK